MVSRLLIVVYGFLVLRFILVRVYYFLKFFIDAYNCIIRMIILSVETLVILGGGLDFYPALLDELVAECLKKLKEVFEVM